MSSTEGHLSQVVFQQRLSSNKDHLPEKVFFHRRSSSTKGRLPQKFVFHLRLGKYINSGVKIWCKIKKNYRWSSTLNVCIWYRCYSYFYQYLPINAVRRFIAHKLVLGRYTRFYDPGVGVVTKVFDFTKAYKVNLQPCNWIAFFTQMNKRLGSTVTKCRVKKLSVNL